MKRKQGTDDLNWTFDMIGKLSTDASFGKKERNTISENTNSISLLTVMSVTSTTGVIIRCIKIYILKSPNGLA